MESHDAESADRLLRENADLHAQLAALVEACAAMAEWIAAYKPQSPLARAQPQFYRVFRTHGQTLRAAVQAVRPQADQFLARLADLSRLVGDQNTTIGYQDAMLALLRGAAIDLLNQLALLTRDDESYLWRIGGRPLDEAYKAMRRAVEDVTKASKE